MAQLIRMTSRRTTQAIILAAGRGERLRPLTDRIPKPLLTVGGVPLIDHQLHKLYRAGIRDCVINVAHLGHLIESHVGRGARYGIRICISREPSGALETGGGIRYAMSRLRPGSFLVLNADAYANYDLQTLELAPNALAHLVLVPNPPHNPRGDFTLRDHRIGNGARARLTFSGIGLYSPSLFANTVAGTRFALAPLLRDAAAAGRVTGSCHRDLWLDIGTAARLEMARQIAR